MCWWQQRLRPKAKALVTQIEIELVGGPSSWAIPNPKTTCKVTLAMMSLPFEFEYFVSQEVQVKTLLEWA